MSSPIKRLFPWKQKTEENKNKENIDKLLEKFFETNDSGKKNHIVGQLQQLGYPNAELLLTIR